LRGVIAILLHHVQHVLITVLLVITVVGRLKMNKYYIIFETNTAKHGKIKETVYDMNTFAGLIEIIYELEQEFKTKDILIHSWRLLS
jgi:hypothetical protein